MVTNDAVFLQGAVVLGRHVGAFEHATVRVYVEDVTRADAAAVVIAQLAIPAVSHQAETETSVPFALRCAPVEPRALYVVRVHVDLQGDGQLHVGDYITTQSYPVLTFGHPDYVTMHVQEVN